MFTRQTEPIGSIHPSIHIYKHTGRDRERKWEREKIYWKKLAYVIMEADNFQDLQSELANQRSRRANGGVADWRLVVLRPRKHPCFSLSPKARKKCNVSVWRHKSSQTGGALSYSAFYPIQGFNWWDETHHIRENNQLTYFNFNLI